MCWQGPFCGHQLAHLGAEVIKVEVPKSGDLARQLGASPTLNKAGMGISFLAQNVGKQSVTLNLKTDEGKSLFKQLVKTADVVIENFRPGVMDRLGLGYTELKEVNPNIVYCAISGYGADGPMRHLPAYDQIIQGMSGVMSITGCAGKCPLPGGVSYSRYHRWNDRRICHLCSIGRQGESGRRFIHRCIHAGVNIDHNGVGGFQFPGGR